MPPGTAAPASAATTAEAEKPAPMATDEYAAEEEEVRGPYCLYTQVMRLVEMEEGSAG
jgi:hypothetical protein